MREAEGAGGKGFHNEISLLDPTSQPFLQPTHTHPYPAIANWWGILPVSREGGPPTACLPLDGVGGLRHLAKLISSTNMMIEEKVSNRYDM